MSHNHTITTSQASAAGSACIRAAGLIDAVRRRISTLWETTALRVRMLTPEHVLFALMIILIVVYVIALIMQPTGAGRGGR